MTAFNGYGKAPPLAAMQQLAKTANFAHWNDAKHCIAKIVDTFSDWHRIASHLGVTPTTRQLIGRQLSLQQQQLSALYQLR